MNKAEYIKLIGDLFAHTKIANQHPNDTVNQFTVDGQNVGLIFDEQAAPNTLFVVIDLGGRSLPEDADRKLLLANSQVGVEQDGLGYFCLWPDPADATHASVVYRCQHRLAGPMTEVALEAVINHACQVAHQRLEQALT